MSGLACLGGGCASWSNEKSTESNSQLLPPRQLNPDSVLIETVLVRFPLSAEEELSEIWRLTNESVCDWDLRRRLDQNGIRTGVILGGLPQRIRQQLENTAEKQTTDALEHAGLAADVDNKMMQLQCRSGRRKDLLVKPEMREAFTILSTSEGKYVTGETFDRATLLFDLRATPHGDGSATVSLTPEVQHGEHRQTFVSTEFGVRPEMRRGVRSWGELKLSVKLWPGQILMVAGTFPPKSLGSSFFVSQTADHSHEHVLLLIRLAESQLDDLFAPDVAEQAQAMAER